ncbi:MAG: type IV pili methyl-accepting chemotaxis transducer N-terminal domain-containing protein [Sulfuricurvum sp.]|nr:type IV pili methyl-accepting chemotaxis transducer N-terminal domain-containing protein [Sulfuricurvum sp.]
MRKITSRIKMISFILSLLLVSLIIITVYLNQQSKHDGYVIHIIGKERMLTQKMAKELFLNLHRQQSDFNSYINAKNEFISNLRSLQTGTHDGKISPPPNDKIALQLTHIGSESDRFMTLAETIKVKIVLHSPPSEGELDELYRVNNLLLEQIDKTVHAYTTASEEKIERLQWIQYLGALATLLAVIGSTLLSKQIDEEFEHFLSNAKEVSKIRCDDVSDHEPDRKEPQNELLQAESDMKTFLTHVEAILNRAQNALIESKNTLIQIEDAAKTMEQQLSQTSLSDPDKDEINDYIDMSENLTINSLEKIATTQQMLDKFQTMLEQIVSRMDKKTEF